MVETARFTPGPWDVSYIDQNGQAVVMGPHTEICTCWHHSVESIRLEMEANARLIAAAPKLLDALESIYLYANDTLSGRVDGPDDREWQRAAVIEVRNRARAAIAKAEGRQP